MEVSKKDGVTTLYSYNKGQLVVKDKEGKQDFYVNMAEGSFLKFNSKGELVEAEIIPKGSSSGFGAGYKLGDKSIVPDFYGETSHEKIIYKDNTITLRTDTYGNFKLKSKRNNKNEQYALEVLNSDGFVKIKGDNIEGKDFSIQYEGDGKSYIRSRWVSITSGSLRLDEDSYNIKAGSKMFIENNNIIIGKGDAKFGTISRGIKSGSGGISSSPSFTENTDFLEGNGIKIITLSKSISTKGNPLERKITRNEYEFNGKLGFNLNSFRLYDNTELKEIISDNNIISYKSKGTLDFSASIGGCSNDFSCIEKTIDNFDPLDFKSRSLSIIARNNNEINIDDSNGNIKNVYSRGIKDNGHITFQQKGSSLQFSKDSFKVDGDLSKLSLDTLETEYNKNGVFKISKVEWIDNNLGRIAVVSECPPCISNGGVVDAATKVRINSNRVNYRDVNSYIDKTVKDYGVKPMKLVGYFDDRSEERLINAYAETFKKYPGLDRNLIIAGSANEGFMNGFVDNSYYTHPDDRVSGFFALGLDHFGEEVDGLKRGGCGRNLDEPCLRSDFSEFDIDNHVNEKSESVVSATFNNMEAGLEAQASRTLRSRDQFLYDARSLGINTGKMTNKDIAFWTYRYYNSGEKNGKVFLSRERGAVPKAGEIIPERIGVYSNSKHNAWRVASTQELLSNLKLFDFGKPIVLAAK